MAGSESVRMTNADFRKILMTPRSGDKPTVPSAPTPLHGDRKHKFKPQKKRLPPAPKFKDEDGIPPPTPDSAYRDRAKERREIAVHDHDQLIMLAATAGYKAVAPDFQSGLDAAERRRKVIEESKYLGGDMEHTHLVKGLDYALLQKVRAELTSNDEPIVPDEPETTSKKGPAKDFLLKKTSKPSDDQDKSIDFKTRMGKNIYNLLFNQELPQRNQYFTPGRMAFLWDLDDEFGNWETPTTILRSKAELRQEDGQDHAADHHIVIEKLTQILSHLRQGIRVSKKVKKDKKPGFGEILKKPEGKPVGESIYDDDVGDYKPTTAKLFARPSSGEMAASAYFKKPEGAVVKETAEDKQRKDNEYIQAVIGAVKKKELAEGGKGEPGSSGKASATDNNRLRVESGPDSYAECYPGFHEAMEAAVDSDDEDDLSKMDHGNNKSVISRKAFDTEEDFSNYMAQREALPKAAFQYGVKMTDGRKKKSSTKNEKAKINSEWSKISAIIQKRKDAGDASDAKRSRAEE